MNTMDSIQCTKCYKIFKNAGGLATHSKYCKIIKSERHKIRELYISGLLISEIIKKEGFSRSYIFSCIRDIKRSPSETIKLEYSKNLREKVNFINSKTKKYCDKCKKFFNEGNLKRHSCFTDEQIKEVYDLYLTGLSSYEIVRKGFNKKLVTIALRGRLRTLSESVKLVRKNNPEAFKVSDKTKEKLSKARIKFLNENPDKIPYKLNHSSRKSWPEEIFERALLRHNLKGWIRRFRKGIYEYDFAFLLEKVDVEVDGQTHESEKVKKIDKRRDEWTQQQGWKIIRFKTSDVLKNVNKCVEELILFLKSS